MRYRLGAARPRRSSQGPLCPHGARAAAAHAPGVPHAEGGGRTAAQDRPAVQGLSDRGAEVSPAEGGHESLF